MQPFEIFNATHRWRNCNDERPWVIVDLRGNGILGCFAVAGECYHGQWFWISASHPDFGKTGLSKSSYVDDDVVYELHMNQFRNRRGELTGTLLQEFRKATGV